MEHITIYNEEEICAGWPANHGAWQWDNELLVGFIRGKYTKSPMHNISGILEFVQARSTDYGKTWSFETTNIPETVKEEHVKEAPEFDLKNSIIRVRGNYDLGGDFINRLGCFWLSHDRGKEWDGPFSFNGLDHIGVSEQNTSRTCVIDNLVFLSKAKSLHWGSDEIFVAEHDGKKFNFVSTVAEFDDIRAVMPDVVKHNNQLIFAARRRQGRKCWIDLYANNPWRKVSQVGETGSRNGNPPALISTGNELVCTFADRKKKCIFAKISYDHGQTWPKEFILRESEEADIGYSRLFQGPDNSLICVYYVDTGEFSSIEGTKFSIDE